MSINGSVGYHRGDSVLSKDAWIQIRKVEITNIGQDIFGQILRASLHLSCDFLLHGTYDHKGARLHYLNLCGHVFQFELTYDHDNRKQTASRERSLHNSNLQIPLILMPIMVQNAMAESTELFAMVLEATGEARGQYRRIGSCEGIFQTSVARRLPSKDVEILDLASILRDGNLPVECLCKDEEYAEIFTDETGKVRKVIELV